MNNKHIQEFLKLNSSVTVKINDDATKKYFVLENLWDDKSFDECFPEDMDLSFLSGVVLPPELVAFFHKAYNKLEFIFAPIDKTDKFFGRQFIFNYKGVDFRCYFAEVSNVLERFARAFRRLEGGSGSDYRNLLIFRDFFNKEKLSENRREYFKEKVPISFYIEGDMERIECDFISLSKHLNLFMLYFDRKSPVIKIIPKEDKCEAFTLPCYSNVNKFPNIINSRVINPTIMDILLIAKGNRNIRLKYFFYFQVLEYCSYYYLNHDLKRRLIALLRNPDVSNNSDYYAMFMIEEFKNFFKQNDDSSKLEKTILDYCTLEDIKLELKTNCSYFSKQITFDGGFAVDAIIKDATALEDSPNGCMILKNVKDNIEKIRNVLVHLRESRENKIILPTRKNENLLLPYLYLVERIAEKIAIKFDME